MKKYIDMVFMKKYEILCMLIVIIAIAMRFVNYEHRWGLAYDQAHDALVARYAVQAGKIPLLGPFSSAGPFQTGGEWYWFLMIPTAIYPGSILSPWIFMTMLYCVFVVVIMRVAYLLEGRFFAVVVGVLATVSTAQIAQGVNLTNQSPQAFFALLSVYAMVKFIQTKKNIFLFFMGLCIGLAGSIHLQGVALLAMAFFTIILTKSIKPKQLLSLFSGLFLPVIPILIYDIGHDMFNIKNMFQYYLHDQYKISLDVLGRRWLTYGGKFIPISWSYVIGGYPILGYVQVVGLFLFFVYGLLKKFISKPFLIISLSTAVMFTILRYTRTPLFDSYLVFLHPFILLLSGYFVYRLVKINKIAGVILLLILITGSLIRDISEIKGGMNYAAVVSNNFKNSLAEKYPNEKFAVFDREYGNKDKSLPLVLFLDAQDKVSDSGRKIGVIIVTNSYTIQHPAILGERGGYQLLDLSSSSSAQLSKDKWALVNPREIYRSTEEWYTKK